MNRNETSKRGRDAAPILILRGTLLLQLGSFKIQRLRDIISSFHSVCRERICNSRDKVPRTLTHMETRELLRGIPLEDGALEELMLGMHIGDVVMILHFEETDVEGECSMIIRQETPHSCPKHSNQSRIQGLSGTLSCCEARCCTRFLPISLAELPTSYFPQKMLVGTLGGASSPKFAGLGYVLSTWHMALGKVCKVEHLAIMIGSRSA